MDTCREAVCVWTPAERLCVCGHLAIPAERLRVCVCHCVCRCVCVHVPAERLLLAALCRLARVIAPPLLLACNGERHAMIVTLLQWQQDLHEDPVNGVAHHQGEHARSFSIDLGWRAP